VAEAALERGARVVLVSAPSSLAPPNSAELVRVTTAEEMLDAVAAKLRHSDVLVMAAAVADFRVDQAASKKVKRGERSMQLTLVPNPDILAETARMEDLPVGLIRVGFAAETEELVGRASEKLSRKRLDLIVGNLVSRDGAVFGSDYNEVVILDASGRQVDVPMAPKLQVAHTILDEVARLRRERGLEAKQVRTGK
jgi:phosphopantothenoylcysteine decarboxylase / phosphopantothenate---cysteine ligase